MESDHQTPPVGDDKSRDVVLREEGESTATTLTHTAAGDVLTPISVTRRRKERRRAVPLLPEVRHFKATGLEIRSNSKTDEIVISGAPIVYDSPYTVTDMFGEFQERMMPGVASDVLSRQPDVRFLFNHDGLPLARSIAGTLALQDSSQELRFTASLDARQQLANDLAIAIERGDVSQMSCGFIVARDEWDDAMEDRSIHSFADLLDVSAVTYPASPTTSIAVAQRMAMAMPVESRARLRRFYVDARAGKTLAPDRVEALRPILDAELGEPESEESPVSEVREAADQTAETTEVEAAVASEERGETAGRVATAAEPDASITTSRATLLRVKLATRGL